MNKSSKYYVYIMASNSGVLYIGFTNDLERRVTEHKEGLIEGFTEKYNCHKLIYVERYNDVYEGLEREKQLKSWRREKKEQLIAKINPRWRNLAID